MASIQSSWYLPTVLPADRWLRAPVFPGIGAKDSPTHPLPVTATALNRTIIKNRRESPPGQSHDQHLDPHRASTKPLD